MLYAFGHNMHKYDAIVHHFRRKCIDHNFILAFTAQNISSSNSIGSHVICWYCCELPIYDLFCVWLLLTSGSKATAMECLEAMASGLYSELFTILISLINRFVFLIQYFAEAVAN